MKKVFASHVLLKIGIAILTSHTILNVYVFHSLQSSWITMPYLHCVVITMHTAMFATIWHYLISPISFWVLHWLWSKHMIVLLPMDHMYWFIIIFYKTWWIATIKQMRMNMECLICHMFQNTQGFDEPYKMLYRQFSRSLEAARYGFARHLVSSAGIYCCAWQSLLGVKKTTDSNTEQFSS